MPDTTDSTVSVYVNISWRAWERIKEIAALERRDPRAQAAILLERTATAPRKRASAQAQVA